MLINILLLILGFTLLIKGADLFVDGASSTASNFKVSKMLIGLTIIAFGTSAPELAVSLKALSAGSTEMVLGNVIGSNILNILLILGVAAAILPIKIKDTTIRKELPMCLLISSLLVVLFLDVSLGGGTINQISRADGISILLFFTVFIYYLIALAKTDTNKDAKKSEKPKWKLAPSLLFTGIGLAGIVLGSNFVVDNASVIATNLGISERIIALTVIALGTSLPELVTTIVASLKGEQDLLLGNIVGSNIFNICVVLGVPVAIFGTVTPEGFQMVDIAMLLISTLLLFIFATTKKTITRAEGILMLTAFVAYYACLLVPALTA